MIYCNCSVLSVVFGTFLLCLVRLLTYCNIIGTFCFFLVNYCNVSGCFRNIFFDDLLYFFQYFLLFSALFCCVWYVYWLTVILSVATFCCFLVNYCNVSGCFRYIFFWWFTVIFSVLSVVFGTFLLCLVHLLTYCNVFGTFCCFLVNYCNVFGSFRHFIFFGWFTVIFSVLSVVFGTFLLYLVLFCCIWYIYWLTAMFSVHFCCFWHSYCNVFSSFLLFSVQLL